MITIITHSDKGEELARRVAAMDMDTTIERSPQDYDQIWSNSEALIFIGALGICVRKIAPYLNSKRSDPAVVNMDVNGEFIQPVVSGHIGGANLLAEQLAKGLNATSVITTVSDSSGLWALDLLGKRFGWEMECDTNINTLTGAFVNEEKTALLLEIRDEGTLFLESNLPAHVDVFYNSNDINTKSYGLVLAITPFLRELGDRVIYYRPKVMHMGVGCQKGLPFSGFEQALREIVESNGVAVNSIASIGSVDLKKDEPSLNLLSKELNVPIEFFESEKLSPYKTPNPSKKVQDVTGSGSVAEASAMHLAKNDLLVEKVKGRVDDKYFTVSMAMNSLFERKGFVEFVGAGPGDPELISVKGKRLLQSADLILYAGSLVPRELTHYAKKGCVVKSSAGMDLNTQISTMQEFYDKKLFVVRLHTGDPCIYGAIQEQMAIMDEYGWNYHITPGISSFQAAAAALRSQFTIPEEVQTIILTRGEGRTPMPDREQLHKLAQAQSTMCIYLSASIASKVQNELLTHYPEDTPVAVCYKLTWKEESIYRCTLSTLAQTVEENNLTMTTLIVVGKAIDNRSGLSKLYHKSFTHAFREGKESKQ